MALQTFVDEYHDDKTSHTGTRMPCSTCAYASSSSHHIIQTYVSHDTGKHRFKKEHSFKKKSHFFFFNISARQKTRQDKKYIPPAPGPRLVHPVVVL